MAEAKPTKEKSAPTVAQVLYEVMCRHGYFDVQTNDQGCELSIKYPMNSTN